MVKAELISIGDELLIGQVINTNAATIAKSLGAIGVGVHRVTTIGDDETDMMRTIRRAWKESDVVIATGGLGPTHDDISKTIVAKFFGRKLYLDAASLRQVKARFKRLGYKTMPEANIGQALVPEGFEPLRNDQGTAPGLWYREKRKVFIILPGVPHEMEWLMSKWVIPKLKALYKGKTAGVILHRVLQTAGVGESALAEKIGNVKAFLTDGVTLAFLPNIGGVRLRITVRAQNATLAREKLVRTERYLRARIKKHIFAADETSLEAAVVALLKKRSATISTAESCTGGMLAMRITNVPGSSEIFPGGIVAYANEVKAKDLNVSAAVIKKYGAVSEEVAVAMAENIRRKLGTTFALSITGIAGPSGGTKEKPVGTVWIALAEKGKPPLTRMLHNVGERQMIRQRSTEFALEYLRLRLIRD